MEFNQILEQKVATINTYLQDFLPAEEGYQKRLIEAMNYSVNAGGKRIRPMFLMESYRLCGGTDIKSIVPFMAAMECIHTYSLVHDDLPAMDNDDYRRGVYTTHKKYGEDFGVLAGDGLLNYAYELMLDAITDIEDVQKQKLAAKAAKVIAKKAGIYGMVGGQSLDVWLTNKSMSDKEMDFIFNLKTGALIEASFMAGAILAGADESVVCNLEKAGNLIGVAFQIKDDILDIVSTQEELGKPTFSDEKNHKTTYVSLYGLEKANADVHSMTDEAIALINSAGDNRFLVDLADCLVRRRK